MTIAAVTIPQAPGLALALALVAVVLEGARRLR